MVLASVLVVAGCTCLLLALTVKRYRRANQYQQQCNERARQLSKQ